VEFTCLSSLPEESGPADVIAEQRELLSRLRAVVEAKDAENAVLRAALDASLERERRKDRKRGGQPGHQGNRLERDGSG
jgi:hypothetical protein